MSINHSRKLAKLSIASYLGIAVFLCALFIRVMGIGWGLPNERHHFSYHPDEDVILSYSKSINPAQGKFDPGFYNYGTFYLTTLSIVGKMVDTYSPSGEKVIEQRAKNIYAGRIINALAGAATALIVFLILLRFTNLWGAGFGSLVVALSPGFVVHSRFQTVDVFATFLLALSFYFALKLIPRAAPKLDDADQQSGDEQEAATSQPSSRTITRCVILSGLFAGLSAGTKYTGILAVLVLVAVIFMVIPKPERLKQIMVGFVLSFVGLVIGTPGILLNTEAFLRDFKYEMLHTSTGHDIVFTGLPSGFIWHFFNLTQALTVAVVLCCLWGIILAIKSKQLWLLVTLAFFVPYYILIGRAEVLFLRYVFPLLIPLALGFGYFVYDSRSKGTKLGHALVVLCILALGGSAMNTSQKTYTMMSEDPRAQAARILQQESERQRRVMTVGLMTDPWFYTPDFYPVAGSMRVGDQNYKQYMDAFAPTGNTGIKVVRYVDENLEAQPDFDVRLVTQLQPDFLVMSSFEADDLRRISKLENLPPELKQRADNFRNFLKELGKNYTGYAVLGRTSNELENLETYAVHDLEYIRPYIWIWKRKSNP